MIQARTQKALIRRVAMARLIRKIVNKKNGAAAASQMKRISAFRNA